MMSVYYFDGQGFVYPRAPPSAPPSFNSSSMDTPSAVQRNFRMSSRRLPVILLVSRIEFLILILMYGVCCAVCMMWPEEVITLYVYYHMSAVSDSFTVFCSSSSSCRLRVLSTTLSARGYCSRINTLTVTIIALAAFSQCQLVALKACVYQPSLPQVTSQARLESDVLDPHPGSTAGYHHQSQALGGPDNLLWPLMTSLSRLVIALGLCLLGSQASRLLFCLDTS